MAHVWRLSGQRLLPTILGLWFDSQDLDEFEAPQDLSLLGSSSASCHQMKSTISET